MAFSGGDDATLAFLRIVDAHEVLKGYVGQQSPQRHVLTAQDNDVPLLRALRHLRHEASELLAGVERPLVISRVKDEEVARVLDPFVHGRDEARTGTEVVVFDIHLVTVLLENVGDLDGNSGHRAPAAQEEVETLSQTIRHDSDPTPNGNGHAAGWGASRTRVIWEGGRPAGTAGQRDP